MNHEPRSVGATDIHVGSFGLGCWPLAGMTREGITHEAAVATVRAAIDAGIVHLDTAYCYGETGESERAIAEAISGRRRDAVVIATKCGIHWEPGRQQRVDGRPDRLRYELEESLRRLGTDHVDLLYLHAPDESTGIEASAEEMVRLLDAGKTRSVGVSNVNLAQLERFASIGNLSACQMHYNMLQREIDAEILPWCRNHNVSMFVYWPLMKGLLAGEMPRNTTFPTTDSRHKYPMFNGAEFQRNLDFVEELRPIATRLDCTLPDLVLAWTAEQPGITCVLFGATSPQQVATNAGAIRCQLDDDARSRIAAAIEQRGPVIGRRPV